MFRKEFRIKKIIYVSKKTNSTNSIYDAPAVKLYGPVNLKFVQQVDSYHILTHSHLSFRFRCVSVHSTMCAIKPTINTFVNRVVTHLFKKIAPSQSGNNLRIIQASCAYEKRILSAYKRCQDQRPMKPAKRPKRGF